jgi:hypothetical protein
MTAELNIHLEDLVSTKTVRPEPHKSNIHGRAAIAKPLITESNAQLRRRWCHVINPGHQTSVNVRDMVGRVVLRVVQEEFCVWRTPKETYNLECLVPTVKYGGGSVMVWAAMSWYNILLVS